MAFESQQTDPGKLLPQVWDNGKLVPNIHFLRRGTYYAFYERDPVTRSATGNLIFKKYDSLRWIKEILAINANLFL